MKNTIELSYGDVVRIASGTNELGAPNSGAILSIDQIISEDKVNNIQNVIFKDAEINIFTSGGCVVVESLFPMDSTLEYNRAIDVCSDWLMKVYREENENNEVLTLTVAPIDLEGQIVIMFDGLVYFNGHNCQNHKKKLVLCFDNDMTNVFQADDIDYMELVKEVEHELQKEEQEMDEKIEELREEARLLNSEQNLYEKHIQEKYGNIDITIEDEEESVSSGMRFSKEE